MAPAPEACSDRGILPHARRLLGGILALAWTLALVGCGGGVGSDSGTDSNLPPVDSGTTEDGGGGGSDSAVGTDAGATAEKVGLVQVGESYGAVQKGVVYGAFVMGSELGLIDGGGLVPITGAPDCFEVAPPPPVVPQYIDAGDLTIGGIIGGPLVLTPGTGGDYVSSGPAILMSADTPITVDVAGSADFLPLGTMVPTPDPLIVGSMTIEASGDITVTWTGGNGDRIELMVGTNNGQRRCIVSDNGTFTIPAVVLAPDTMPAGGYIGIRRVTESIVQSLSIPPHELIVRGSVRDEVL